jgi:protein gp37
MGEQTGIRWTDATDNIIRVQNPKWDADEHADLPRFGGFYCIKISPGCTNCYAADMVATGRFGEKIPYVAGPNAPDLYLDEAMLAGWAKKTKPKRRFVSSMTDICGEFVKDPWYWKIMDAERAATTQTFLNLTKRADRMASLTHTWMRKLGLFYAPLNIWQGFSAENQEWFDKRWPLINGLGLMYGFTTWVSAEPLLGPIILPGSFLAQGKKTWLIIGGESGPNARPMQPQWARDLRDQCVAAGVPVFFKQWGNWIPYECLEDYSWQSQHGDRWHGDESFADKGLRLQHTKLGFLNVGKEKAGHLLDGVEWSQFPNE